MRDWRRALQNIPVGVATGVCAIAILWLTLAPKPLGSTELQLFSGADKLVHGIMFGGLCGCLLWDLALRHWHISGMVDNWHLSWCQKLLCVLLTALFGAGIELAQAAMGLGRGCEAWDFIADAVGAIFGVVIAPGVIKWVLK